MQQMSKTNSTLLKTLLYVTFNFTNLNRTKINLKKVKQTVTPINSAHWLTDWPWEKAGLAGLEELWEEPVRVWLAVGEKKRTAGQIPVVCCARKMTCSSPSACWD